MTEEEILKQPLEAQNFLRNWNPEGKVAMDAVHIEGLAPLPVVEKEEKVIVETPDAKAPAAETKTTETVPVVDSLTDENKPTDSPVKSWEETLAERSGGKYKTYEELEALISAPKKNEYKSTLAEKIDEYVSQGGTEEDYLQTQATDFTKMSTRELIEYKIQMEDPDMTDAEVNYEIKRRYGVDKWKGKPEEYEEGIEPEEIQMNKLRFEREAKKTQSELLSIQKKWAIPEKKVVQEPVVDPKIQEKWDSDTKQAIDKFSKLQLKISDKESYDLVIDDKEKNEIADLTKKLFTSNGAAFWDQFKDKEGKIQVESIVSALVRTRNFDKAVQFATAQARDKGKEAVVKDDIKNIDFSPSGKSVEAKKPTTEDAIKAQAVKIARGEA